MNTSWSSKEEVGILIQTDRLTNNKLLKISYIKLIQLYFLSTLCIISIEAFKWVEFLTKQDIMMGYIVFIKSPIMIKIDHFAYLPSPATDPTVLE